MATRRSSPRSGPHSPVAAHFATSPCRDIAARFFTPPSGRSSAPPSITSAHVRRAGERRPGTSSSPMPHATGARGIAGGPETGGPNSLVRNPSHPYLGEGGFLLRSNGSTFQRPYISVRELALAGTVVLITWRPPSLLGRWECPSPKTALQRCRHLLRFPAALTHCDRPAGPG